MNQDMRRGENRRGAATGGFQLTNATHEAGSLFRTGDTSREEQDPGVFALVTATWALGVTTHRPPV